MAMQLNAVHGMPLSSTLLQRRGSIAGAHGSSIPHQLDAGQHILTWSCCQQQLGAVRFTHCNLVHACSVVVTPFLTLVQGSGSCSNAGHAAHGGSVTHAVQNQRRRQSRPTRQRQRSALLCARFLVSGSLAELFISACMRWTESVNTEVHRISTCHQFIPGAPQSNVQGPPLYAIAVTRPEDVQTGEAIAAADASTNGAPAAMGITTGDTSAELPAGELRWDPPSGEHTGHSELHMCQSQELRVARACEGAVPVAGT